MTAIDTVGVPRLRLLNRTEEHLIQTQRVGTVAFNNHIGIHHVEHRLRHLLDGPAADVLAILEHELCIVVFRTPSLEGLEVEDVGRDNVYVDVDGGELIVGSTGLGSFLHHVQAEEYRVTGFLAGFVVTIDEVRTTLYHTLIDEFLERLFHVAHTEVEEELVPEARVDEVTRCVLRTANVEVNVLPVFGSLRREQGFVVVRVHVAQIIGAGASEARHRAELQGEDGHVVDSGAVDNAIRCGVPRPTLGVTKWRFTGLSGLIGLHLRQLQRQALGGNHIGHVVLVVHREWLTPVALAREDGVAQTVVHFYTTESLFRDVFLRSGNSFLHRQTVQRELTIRRVGHDAFLRIEAFF